jgi:hypothetical protein
MVHVHNPEAAAIDMATFHENVDRLNGMYPRLTISAIAVRCGGAALCL